MNNLETFKLARDYIRRGWTQNTGARDDEGSSVLVTDPDAVSWCMLGALDVACRMTDNSYEDLKYVLGKFLGVSWDKVAEFNDRNGRTVEQVLAVYDRIIENESRNVAP